MPHLIVVGDVIQLHLTFHFNCVLQVAIQAPDQVLSMKQACRQRTKGFKESEGQYLPSQTPETVCEIVY